MSDESITDVPIGLPDHVGKENSLDLIQEEDLGDSLEDLIDWKFECDGAAAGDGPEYRYN